MRKLLTVLLLLGLSAPSYASVKDDICSLLRFDCQALPEPTIIESKVLIHMSYLMSTQLYGMYYDGEKYIYINPDHPDKREAAIIHETVHYILWHSGIFDRCLGEELAREVTAHMTNTEVDPAWIQSYNCDPLSSSSGETPLSTEKTSTQ